MIDRVQEIVARDHSPPVRHRLWSMRRGRPRREYIRRASNVSGTETGARLTTAWSAFTSATRWDGFIRLLDGDLVSSEELGRMTGSVGSEAGIPDDVSRIVPSPRSPWPKSNVRFATAFAWLHGRLMSITDRAMPFWTASNALGQTYVAEVPRATSMDGPWPPGFSTGLRPRKCERRAENVGIRGSRRRRPTASEVRNLLNHSPSFTLASHGRPSTSRMARKGPWCARSRAIEFRMQRDGLPTRATLVDRSPKSGRARRCEVLRVQRQRRNCPSGMARVRSLFSLADRAVLQRGKRRTRLRPFRGARLAVDSSAHVSDPGQPLVSEQNARAVDRRRTRRGTGGRFFPTETPTTVAPPTPSKASPSTRSEMLWRPGSGLGPWGGLPVGVSWRMRHGKSATPETTTPPPRPAIGKQRSKNYENEASMSPKYELV